jgi:hypothetical protein
VHGLFTFHDDVAPVAPQDSAEPAKTSRSRKGHEMLRRFHRATALLLGATLALISCGGGGSSTASNGVGSGGTGSYTNGPISGLGSIIVNGIRFNVNAAQVLDDNDGVTLASPLLLGMVVEVQGSAITAGATTDSATAQKVRFGSLLVGRSTVTSSTVTVLGQVAAIDTKTVIATPVVDGDWVEVHGLIGVGGALTATRIDKLSSTPTTCKITGLVSSISGSMITLGQGGSVVVSYSSVSDLPAGLVVGSQARVPLVYSSTAASGCDMTLAGPIKVRSQLVSESAEARLNGVVVAFPDATHVQVGGVLVDRSRTSVKPSTASLIAGARVEVEGQMVSGALVATEINVRDQAGIDNDEIELHGTVAQLTSSTFVLRNVNVSYSAGNVFGGTLLNGVCVVARGSSYDSSGQLIATKVEVKSDCE